jgi:pimeloyl-ACP methyl ester carboxylesterase
MRRLLMLPLLAACGADSPEASLASLRIVEEFAVTSDSVRIFYRVVGSGPEAVLAPHAHMHGTRLDALASDSRRLVLYDQRGRGRSDSVPAEKISLNHLFLDLEAVRQAVGADSVALIGWSGAGMELFVYALRHPGRITRLVQLAPVAPRWVPYAESLMTSRQARTDSAAAARLNARVRAGEFTGNEAGLCRAQAQVYTPASFGDTSLARLAPDVCEWSNEWPSRIGAFFGVLLGSIEGMDWRADLARVSVPRLVIHGELDNTPLAGNCEWVTGHPSARLAVIRGAGHWPHYERPEETLALIRAFLDGKQPAGGEADPCG